MAIGDMRRSEVERGTVRLRGELMGLGEVKRGLRAANVRHGEARQTHTLAALDVVRVNDGAQGGREQQRAGGGGAERQRDDRGERGSEGGRRKRIHVQDSVDAAAMLP